MQASDSTWSANWQKTFFRLRTPPVALREKVKFLVRVLVVVWVMVVVRVMVRVRVEC